MAEPVLDLTTYKALCGDPVVHMVEKAKELPVGGRLIVIMSRSDFESASKVFPNLENLGVRVIKSECGDDRCTVVVERTS